MNRPRMNRLRLTVVAVLAMVCLGLSGCGYAVGGGYSPQYQTVYVPTFVSDSYRRGIELQLTEGVQKEIQLRTPYQLARGPAADTRLTGRVIEVRKDVIQENRYDDPRELQLSIAVEVEWEDLRTGQVLARRQIPLGPDAVQLVTQSSFAPEVGHSLATATQTAVEDLSREIVQIMEVPW